MWEGGGGRRSFRGLRVYTFIHHKRQNKYIYKNKNRRTCLLSDPKIIEKRQFFDKKILLKRSNSRTICEIDEFVKNIFNLGEFDLYLFKAEGK